MPAIVIGLNYKGTKYELSSCDKDAEFWSSYLTSTGRVKSSEIHVFNDITKQELQLRFASITADLTAKDTMWLTFSGHGTYVKDNNKDEKDGRDEAIVLSDFSILKDDELVLMIGPLLQRGVTVMMVIDSCHSGTIADLPYYAVERNPRVLKRADTTKTYDGNALVISACNDSQLAAEYTTGGALTSAMRLFLEQDPDVSLHNMISRITITGQTINYSMSRALDLSKSRFTNNGLHVSTQRQLTKSRASRGFFCGIM